MLDGVGTMLTIGMIAVVMLMLGAGYATADFFFIDDVKEVTEPIKPEMKIVTDGKTVDTVYVYKFR